MDDLIYKIALTLIPGVGSVYGKSLVAYCGGVQAVFLEKKRALLKIPGIGEQAVNAITNSKVFARAEEEITFIQRNNINTLFYLDKDYPIRLKQCNDNPLLLYYKGNPDFNSQKVVAMVGTRNATEYGREMCRKIIEGLKSYNALIISGLAYGIDTWSHKAAVDNGLPTVGVLGHGLDRVYPYSNKPLAERMISNGGLLSEFLSNTNPDRENFPKRNRIIAGLSDAVVVVEAGEKGGALITAELADSYNRDVMAVPGRVTDSQSAGCNKLIKINKASLLHSAEDIAYLMGWDQKTGKQIVTQPQLFREYTSEEILIINTLREKGDTDIDSLLIATGLLPSKAATLLLNMEFEGLIRCLPGKIYRLV